LNIGSHDTPSLARSASVREPTTKSHPTRQTVIVGGLSQKPGQVDDAEKKSRDTKRRTVQVEYVAPKTSSSAKGVKQTLATQEEESEHNQDSYNRPAANSSMAPPIRPGRDTRAVSDNTLANSTPYYSSQRPATGGGVAAPQTYGQPAVGIVKEQAQGRFSQPRLDQDEDNRASNRHSSYIIAGPPSSSQGFQPIAPVPGSKRNQGHKRSSTLSGLTEKFGFVKRASLFGGSKNNTESEESAVAEKPTKKNKRFPPVSMARPIANDNSVVSTASDPRPSTDSSHRKSFSFRRSRTGDNQPPTPEDSTPTLTETKPKRSSRRFSLLPFSRSSNNSQPSGKDDLPKPPVDHRPKIAFGRGESRSPSRSTTESNIPALYDSQLDHAIPRKPLPPSSAPTSAPRAVSSGTTAAHSMGLSQGSDYDEDDDQHNTPVGMGPAPGSAGGYGSMGGGDSRPSSGAEPKPGVLHKKRDHRFNDAFEQEGSGHAGSSGAARRVMAMFNFRRKGRS
jgi:protein-serine/threonine kinase